MSVSLSLLALVSGGAPLILDCDSFRLHVRDEARQHYQVSGKSMHWSYGASQFDRADGSVAEGLRLQWQIQESTGYRRGPNDLVVTLAVSDYDPVTGMANYEIEGVAPPRNPRFPAHIRRISPFYSSGTCTTPPAEEPIL